ncbi:ABC transporter permease [Azonexus sp.]|uniref:ABC transporter permease n=1 Tax=Azonexus sp. TaxID=1872668 RepID=UPI0027B8FA97|nr:FtsX-like permease family protein [Azonexus sp.]
MIFGLAWRMLGRELRSGEMRLLFVALCIAVAAVSAVGFLADRVGRALEVEARQMLGADLVVVSDQPLDKGLRQEAEKRGLRTAQTLVFPSMVLAGGRSQLVEIKAVSDTYPLRGLLRTATQPGLTDVAVNRGPTAKTVWVDERLHGALGLLPETPLHIGQLVLPATALITREPDRSMNLFAMAPRLMMHIDDVPASGLLQFGARVRYRLLIAGPEKALAEWRDWASGKLARGQRLEDIENARPEIRTALDKAQRFLGLATLLTVILSAIAVALAARRYMQRHLDACAVLRCLGTTQGRLLRLHALSFLAMALAAALLGVLFGFAAHFVLVSAMADLVSSDLPLPGIRPALEGALVAGVLLFGFAMPPLLQLARVPTLRVLRRELGPPAPLAVIGYLFGFLLLCGLIFRAAGDVRLGSLAIAGFSGALALFWFLAWLAIRLASRWRGGIGFGWRQGLATLARHGTANTLKIVALGIGLMALLLLGVTRLELVDAWQKSVPADAPNRFVINIQPEQQVGVAQWLAGQGIAAELAPMVRARLLRINERSVSAADFPDDDRAQRLIEREFNLSWRASLPDGNEVTAGRWFAAAAAGNTEKSGKRGAQAEGEASVEAGLAKTLGIALGDRLVFSVAGEEKNVAVTSLRKLDWDSMRVNFFVLTPPGVLDDAPASYITSFHLPTERRMLASQLVEAFPNLTVIDIDAILAQIQSVVGQVVGAVQFVFLFTLAAGAVVLYAAFLSAIDERRFELAVMRALGARREQLRQALLVELAAVGALAGMIAALGAAGLGQLLARQVFQIEPEFSLTSPLIVAAGCALATTFAGWLGMRRLLGVPPLEALRQGN